MDLLPFSSAVLSHSLVPPGTHFTLCLLHSSPFTYLCLLPSPTHSFTLVLWFYTNTFPLFLYPTNVASLNLQSFRNCLILFFALRPRVTPLFSIKAFLFPTYTQQGLLSLLPCTVPESCLGEEDKDHSSLSRTVSWYITLSWEKLLKKHSSGRVTKRADNSFPQLHENALMIIDSLPQAEYQSANQGFPWNLELVAQARTIAVMLDSLSNGFYFNFCLYFLELPVTWHYDHACWLVICLFSCIPCFCAAVFHYGSL